MKKNKDAFCQMISRLCAAAVFAILLGACSGTKNLKAPELNIPGQFGAYTDTISIADRPWRDFYPDTVLCGYIEHTLANNKDLLVAAARVDELGELYGVEKLNYLPDLSGVVGATRETNDYYGEAFKGSTEHSLKATLSWETDLWGRLGYLRKKALATYLGSAEEQRAMQITLVAQVATAYYNLVALKNELNIVRQTLLTREQALEKAKLRYEGGLTSEIVYQQSKVEYATAAALVPAIQQRITLAKNALNLLMGRLPETEVTVNPEALDTDPGTILPPGIPSALLERRPDVKAAELALEAALANCGVVYANRFPKFMISITGGWENNELKDFFRSPFSYLLGNITGTIFDFGRNKRKYKASIAAYEQARLKYEKSVLAAFSEVDGAITTFNELQNTTRLRTELRDAAAKYVDLANKQYFGGTINYIDVLDAHRRYFEARLSQSNAVRDEYLAMVALYKALGGGWH